MGSYTISDRELGSVQRGITKRDSIIERQREQHRVGQGVALGCSYGAAFAIGYVRGTKEDPNTGAWNIPGSTVDWEAAAAVTLAAGTFAASMKDSTRKYSNYLCFAALGVGCHYLGQIGRKMGRTGKFSTVAGVPGIGALPQYNPESYNPTQFSDPYADPVASSLASSGV